MKHISEILEISCRPCFEYNPSSNTFSWFLFKDILSYSSGSRLFFDNSSTASLSSLNLEFVYHMSDGNAYFDEITYNSETNLLGGKKKKIIEKFERINSATSAFIEKDITKKISDLPISISQYDVRPVLNAFYNKITLCTMAFDEAACSSFFAKNTPFIYVLHKSQIEKMNKVGLRQFEIYFIMKMQKIIKQLKLRY